MVLAYLHFAALFFVCIFATKLDCMRTQQNWASEASVLEFVTVSVEYCAMLEQLASTDKNTFITKMQKLLPLLYLKASLLPQMGEDDESFLQNYVTEDDWLALFLRLKNLLGEDVEYLEVFDTRMTDSEAPIVASLAENFADIYQDLRDFLTNFHLGTEELVAAALWQLQTNFANYWGQYTVNALRAVHHIVTKQKDTNDF